MSIPRISVLDRLFFLVFGGMMVLIVGLYGLGFDLVESPAWQVGVYHLMLVLLASMPVIVSLSPFWDLGGLRLRLWMTVIALFMPAVVLAFDWFQGGTYAGFRDPRLMIDGFSVDRGVRNASGSGGLHQGGGSRFCTSAPARGASFIRRAVTVVVVARGTSGAGVRPAR